MKLILVLWIKERSLDKIQGRTSLKINGSDTAAMNQKYTRAVGVVTGVILIILFGTPGYAKEPCRPIEERPIKIEAWVSKKDMKDYRMLRNKFEAMGYTYAALWPYPGRNPSRVVAIGQCVPAYIARHALQQALIYYGEVNSLVHQNFVSGHWVGLGTSLFAESSQQPINKQQLRDLLDPALDTYQFHELYQKLTEQDTQVSAFGQMLPNPKLMK